MALGFPTFFSGRAWPSHFQISNFAKISLSNTIRTGSIVKVNCFCVRLRTTSYICVFKTM